MTEIKVATNHINVRIFSCPGDGSMECIRQYPALIAVPRVGDHIAVQHIFAKVFEVEWFIASNCQQSVDIYCDTSELYKD